MSKRKADEVFEDDIEVWKDCLEKYEVSSLGNVRRKSDKRPIKTFLNGAGYPVCGLRRDGKGGTHRVHRLVALAFLEKPSEEYETVDHINRVRDDPRLSNLRWATRTEQCSNTSPRKKKPRPIVRMISIDETTDFDNVDEATDHLIEKLDLDSAKTTVRTRIRKAISGELTYKGYVWEYVTHSPTGTVRNIPSLPSYSVSSCGMVQHLHGRWTKGMLQQGYLIVGLNDNSGNLTRRCVHRLVAETFNDGQTNESCIVNHINGCKTDNRSENLEWVTSKQNSNHAVETGLIKKEGRKVEKLDIETGSVLQTFSSISSASRSTGISRNSIKRCVHGIQESANGFKWRFSETKDGEETRDWRFSGKTLRVNQIDLETGAVLETYRSLTDASKHVDGSPGALSNCAKGKNKTAYGFRWEYAEKSS